MSDTTYNGWANYPTWRVNLEIFDGQAAEDLGILGLEPYEAGQALKDYTEELVSEGASGLALDYALSFLSNVEWHEIASHLLEDAE